MELHVTLDDAGSCVVLKVILCRRCRYRPPPLRQACCYHFPKKAEQIARGLDHENVINVSLLMWGWMPPATGYCTTNTRVQYVDSVNTGPIAHNVLAKSFSLKHSTNHVAKPWLPSSKLFTQIHGLKKMGWIFETWPGFFVSIELERSD